MRLTLTLHANTIGWIEYIKKLVMHMQSYPDLLHARHCLPTALSPSFRSSDTSLWIASKMSRLAIYWKRKEKRRRGWGWDTGSTIVFVQSDIVLFFLRCWFLCSYYTRVVLIYLIWIARRYQQWLDKVHMSNTVMTDAVSSPHSPPVLVSATERSSTTLTALALAHWPSSEIIAHLCMYSV